MRVLVLCTGNSARSQMAEGLLRQAGFEAASAGTKPGMVRPEAIEAMREIGIDISHQRSKHVDELANESFNLVLTVCDHAREICPILPEAGKTVHHAFDDPAAVEGSFEERLAAFRRIRDELREYINGIQQDTGFS